MRRLGQRGIRERLLDLDGLTGAERDHVLVSADDMARLGISHDDPIRLESPFGTYDGRAFRAPIAPGNLEMHWPEANHLLDPGRIDPGGRVPDYNTTVRLSKRAI